MMGQRKTAVGVVLAAFIVLLGGLWLAARVQGGPDVRVEAVTFTGRSGAHMRALLFRPAADAKRPAPGILAFHGYLNSAEMQGNFATEYARRGYVVLAPDQRGHGSSDPATFADGFGGPDALAYLRSLPFVDKDNIGLEGHSMGGWAVLSAAAAFPDGYRALVLEGSSVGAPFAPEGSTTFPRNLLVVYGRYDEFGGFMWGPGAPSATGTNLKLRRTFGSAAPVEPGRLYGDMSKGNARMLLTPPVVHAWLHESSAGITPALSWFARTLQGAKALPVDDQIWPWRELGGALALVAVPVLMLGVMALLLPGRMPAQTQPDTLPRRAHAGRMALFALLPAVLFIPLSALEEVTIGQNGLLRQTFTNQYALWALVCAGLGWIMVRPTAEPAVGVRPGKAVLVAVLAVCAAYGPILLADRLVHVNPAWGFITIRPLTLARLRDFVVYLPCFTLFTWATLRALDTLWPLDQGRAAMAFFGACALLGGGFALFLLVQYGTLWLTGYLLLAGEGLRTITAIGFIPVFITVAGFGTASRRWTGSVLTGALVSGLFVTWLFTATQPIGV